MLPLWRSKSKDMSRATQVHPISETKAHKRPFEHLCEEGRKVVVSGMTENKTHDAKTAMSGS